MERKEFKRKAKQGIDEIFTKIDELETKKDNVKEDVKEKYHEQIEELKEKKNDLQEKYIWLVETADEKWEEAKISFSKAFDSFKVRLAKITASFKA